MERNNDYIFRDRVAIMFFYGKGNKQGIPEY